jgi:hypothetical protein
MPLFATKCSTDDEWKKHVIDLKTAQENVERYNAAHAAKPNGFFFSRNDIGNLTDNNPNISGVRYYHGIQGGVEYLLLAATQLNASNQHDDITSLILISPAYKGATTIGHDNLENLTIDYQAANPGKLKGGFFPLGAINFMKNPSAWSGLDFLRGLNSASVENMNIFSTILSTTGQNHDHIGAGARNIDMSIPCPDQCGSKNKLNNIP